MIKNWNIPKEVWVLIIIAISGLIIYLIPITLVLGNQEITNPEIALNLSLFPMLFIVGVIVVASIYFTRRIWRRENKFGDGFGFFNIGKFPASKIFEKFTAMQLTLLSGIVFSILFLVANLLKVLGKGFTGNILLPTQQFTSGEALAFSTFLVPGAEEYLSLAIISIAVLVLVLMAVRYNWSQSEFRGYYFGLIPIFIGGLAMIWHNTTYQNSDISLFIVFCFWAIKTLLILVTGFFVVGWIFHAFNNFFISYTALYSNSASLGITIFLIAVLGGFYWYLYFYRKKRVV